MTTMRDRLAEFEPDLLFADGFDEALLGLAQRAGTPCVVAYDRSRCIDLLAREMPREEAEEHFEFNVAGAYVGERTPVFIDTRWCE